MTDPITTAELLPCPLCGGEARFADWEDDSQSNRFAGVRCKSCGVEIGLHVSWHETGGEQLRDAAAAWNRRALPIARPVAGAEMVEKVARALCEGAIGGRCACSGEFSCADEYPGRQARAALAAMGYEVRE